MPRGAGFVLVASVAATAAAAPLPWQRERALRDATTDQAVPVTLDGATNECLVFETHAGTRYRLRPPDGP